MTTTTLLGREHPAALLHGEIDRVLTSHGGLVLVTGEAGIGKTTLVTDAVRDARRRGALVLSGSCWDSENAPGYWPWVQVVRGLRRALSAEERAAAESGSGVDLSVLLGERDAPASTDAFEVHDAVTAALVAASQDRPVVVVLEDLHWADSASLRLLEFAAQHTWFERLLLVGTYRDVEVEPGGHPLRPLLAPLLGRASTVTLTGLTREEVRALMARTAGREPDAELVAEVHRRTGGNPFFVEQTTRLWLGGGPAGAIAPGVRDALQRRLSLLPGPVVQLLSAAAVLGREFHRPLLAATAGAPAAQVEGLLEQAVTARLVTAHGGGRFSFTHDLVRETLYGALEEDALRERHATVVRAADQTGPAGGSLGSAELARHAHLAGDRLPAARRVELLTAAAEEAWTRLAVEESLAHRRRALEVAEAHAEEEPERPVTVALALADALAQVRSAAEAARAYREAARWARSLEAPALLARVALSMYQTVHEPCRFAASDVHFMRALLGEAYRALEPRGAARVGEGEPDGTPSAASAYEMAKRLTVRTAVLARRGEDDEALAFSLWARHSAIWGMGSAPEREALMAELQEVTRRAGDLSGELFATALRWVALLQQGKPGFFEQFRAFADESRWGEVPLYAVAAAIDRCVVAGFQGRFPEAETHLARAETLPETRMHAMFTPMKEHVRWSLGVVRGRPEDANGPSLDPVHQLLLEGITALERGDVHRGARVCAQVREVAESGPSAFEALWLRLQAQAAAATGDEAECARVREALAPYAGQWLVALHGCEISGPVDLWLGAVEAARQRWDAAVAALTAARRAADRLGAVPWSLHARARLAEVLQARGAEGDAREAAALRAEVAREAAEIGMAPLVAQVEEASDRTPPAAAPAARDAQGAEDAEGPEDAPAARAFRREGPVWALTFAGRTVRLPDAKGLRDLHQLLGQPGTDVPAVRLLAPEGGEEVVAARRMGGDELLDAEARDQYRRRLELLDEEIDRAVARGDDGRAAEYDRERAALLEELRAAAGLGGRGRRLGDEAERARKTVTARIRDTLRRLDRRHPELAAHLRATVSTGASCRYQPEPGGEREETVWRL